MTEKESIYADIKRITKEMNQIKQYEKALGWSESTVVSNLIIGAKNILAFSAELENLEKLTDEEQELEWLDIGGYEWQKKYGARKIPSFVYFEAIEGSRDTTLIKIDYSKVSKLQKIAEGI